MARTLLKSISVYITDTKNRKLFAQAAAHENRSMSNWMETVCVAEAKRVLGGQ